MSMAPQRPEEDDIARLWASRREAARCAERARLDDRIEALRQRVRDGDAEPATYRELARSLQERGDSEAAVEAFRAAVGRFPADRRCTSP